MNGKTTKNSADDRHEQGQSGFSSGFGRSAFKTTFKPIRDINGLS